MTISFHVQTEDDAATALARREVVLQEIKDQFDALEGKCGITFKWRRQEDRLVNRKKFDRDENNPNIRIESGFNGGIHERLPTGYFLSLDQSHGGCVDSDTLEKKLKEVFLGFGIKPEMQILAGEKNLLGEQGVIIGDALLDTLATKIDASKNTQTPDNKVTATSFATALRTAVNERQ